MVDESEIKPTNDGQGERVNVRYNILDGKYAGRKVFGGFNIKNANPKAMEIAWRQLSALCHAVGVLDLQDTQHLHGIPFKLKVTLEAAREDKESGKTYDAKNDTKGWRHINDTSVEVGVPAGPARTAPPVALSQPQQPGPATGQWAAQPQQPGTQFGNVQQPPAQPWAQPQQPQQQPQQPAAWTQPANSGAPVQPQVQQWTPPANPQAAAGQQPPWVQQQPAQGAPQQPAAQPPWAQQAPQQAQPAVPTQTQPQPWAGGPAGAVPPWAQPK
jgi:hypothetical protein